MNRRTFFAAGLLAVVVGWSFISGAAVAAQPKEPKEKPEQWTIVQVDEDYHAVRKTGLKDFQKSLNDKYTGDLKSWQEAKKAAAKSKEKFEEPQPVRPKVKPLNKTFASEELANESIQKLKDEQDKAKKKK